MSGATPIVAPACGPGNSSPGTPPGPEGSNGNGCCWVPGPPFFPRVKVERAVRCGPAG